MKIEINADRATLESGGVAVTLSCRGTEELFAELACSAPGGYYTILERAWKAAYHGRRELT